ncbi:cytoplasmic trehalase [Klebsiella michiganensis]|uniref:Cytoplasmic trehalase n=1 Tax=Klebsiella michiganensis TaxID=1134687 RepID=A0A7H4M4B9_9ENTR|nr:cytoplasmic trehalase [Klebsiella michiganensis]
MIHYRRVRRTPGFDLRQFVEDHFWLPENRAEDYVSDPTRSLKEHIDNLWPVLTREPQDHIPLVIAAGAAAVLYCAWRAV